MIYKYGVLAFSIIFSYAFSSFTMEMDTIQQKSYSASHMKKGLKITPNIIADHIESVEGTLPPQLRALLVGKLRSLKKKDQNEFNKMGHLITRYSRGFISSLQDALAPNKSINQELYNALMKQMELHALYVESMKEDTLIQQKQLDEMKIQNELTLQSADRSIYNNRWTQRYLVASLAINALLTVAVTVMSVYLD
jgi:hypothetical protein